MRTHYKHRHHACQETLLGVALDFSDEQHTAVWHDATGIIGTEVIQIVNASTDEGASAADAAVPSIVKLIDGVEAKGFNIRLVAVADPIPRVVELNLPKIWLHADAIPVHIPTHTRTLKATPAARSGYAISHALTSLHPATMTATNATVGEDQQVLVDVVGKEGHANIAGRREYEQSTSPELWTRFMALTNLLRDKSIVFFSATPQGGGVALMRHALLRLWHAMGLNVKWYVPEAHPTIFDITKRKLHNVLQGVAPEGCELSDTDKTEFELWGQENYNAFWTNINADLVIIDDPQLTPIIPFLKKNTTSKIIFRSHIQIRADLCDTPDTPQARTWDYLFDFIKHTDLFLSHPVEYFVPKNVRDEMKVLYAPPSTDPIDGLNKPYGATSVQFFRDYFNTLSVHQCGVRIDWKRGYIVQVARFDPSKGYDVLLKAYLRFRERVSYVRAPQLILVGHGSVDDPDGKPIFTQLQRTLDTDEYASVRDDVAVVRAPPSDSLLGVLLQGAWVVTQLSTREGFEVKVTEAVEKGVPLIASDAGGIPLQVSEGRGWVVPAGQSEPVADTLYDIYTGRTRLCACCDAHTPGGTNEADEAADEWVRDYDAEMPQRTTSEDFWTVGNATRWMLLAARLLGVPETDVTNPADLDVLKAMGSFEPLPEYESVWKMVMGKDMKEGEGRILRHPDGAKVE